MTAKEIAAKLDGREYGHEITQDEERIAKESGLVVVCGYSDDGVEFYGAVDDEAGCFGGGTIYLNRDGLLHCPDCDPEWRGCPYYKREKERAKAINAVWCPSDTDFSWVYETDIPHETFRILEDGEHYCLGIVFSVEDL